MRGSSEGWRKKEEVLVSVVPVALTPLQRGSPNGHTHTVSNKGQQNNELEKDRGRVSEREGGGRAENKAKTNLKLL